MRNSFQNVFRVALTLCALAGVASSVRAAPVEPDKSAALKPDVAALIKQSTDAYQKMKAYQHLSVVKSPVLGPDGDRRELIRKFTLALERPNKFCYKINEGPSSGAAVCDGKTSIIYKNDQMQNQYMQKAAPETYKGINIVDDVVFEPLGTYLVALMLQGDALADKDVKAGLEKATMLPPVTEDGKKWQILHVPFGPRETPFDFYFGADDHLIGKVVARQEIMGNDFTETETEQNIRINKPVEPSTYEYKPPANAKKVEKFTAPQRQEDAQNIPVQRSSSATLSLAAFRGRAPQADVAALLKQSTEAYQKLKTYQHRSVAKVIGTAKGKTLDESDTNVLVLERPNKFYCKSGAAKGDISPSLALSDGTNFFNYRGEVDEYIKKPAPADFKSINLAEDVTLGSPGTHLVALLLQGNLQGDKTLYEAIEKATVKRNVMEDGKKWDVLTVPIEGNPIQFYFDAANHLLGRAFIKVPDQDITMTETLSDVKANQPIDAGLFRFDPPKTAQLVTEFSDPDQKKLVGKYEGKPAKDFTLQDRDGKEVSLASLKGKIVVVDFWASWCVPCKAVMPTLQEIHDKLGSDVVVLAVDSFDEKADCDKFLKANPQYTMRILRDPAGTDADKSIASTLYGVEGIPTTLIIDREGVLRKYLIGEHDRGVYMGLLRNLGIKNAR
ncbi:MAG TPA: redoxin domain-containing protein [Chthonomonadaceae bacterium]|nr:redoxin domain-containing protein [Chthonomonadaceae bacterium]